MSGVAYDPQSLTSHEIPKRHATTFLVQPNRPRAKFRPRHQEGYTQRSTQHYLFTFSSLYLATMHSYVQNHIILMRRR